MKKKLIIRTFLSGLVVFVSGVLLVIIVTAPIEPEDYTPEERITFLEEEVDRCKDANKSLVAVVDALKNATPTPEPDGMRCCTAYGIGEWDAETGLCDSIPATTQSEQDKNNCETWRFDLDAEPVLIESNADMAALSLEYAYGVYMTNKCSEFDASFNEDVDLYLTNMFETLEILTSWLIQEEVDG